MLTFSSAIYTIPRRQQIHGRRRARGTRKHLFYSSAYVKFLVFHWLAVLVHLAAAEASSFSLCLCFLIFRCHPYATLVVGY
ncbi:Hypothetical protein NTJ_13979 [Nesidiocoris tenuis]|uniref:Uncharacterized protein n=1 Tax=Nesidiocoris tenuis TaxID=355587 RepID=A0ABN7BBW1_9HEMI|nr:Hypothetical protein NTJ_13979 [Nesidiocoris tenuis]